MTLGNGMIVVSVWHHLRHHVSAGVGLPPCKCSAGVATKAGRAMVRGRIAKVTQMRHDDL